MKAEERLQARKDIRDKHISDQKAEKKKEAAQPNESAKRENKIEAFRARVGASSDLADEL